MSPLVQRAILAREAHLLRMVNHPHIVRCFQVLETPRQQVRDRGLGGWRVVWGVSIPWQHNPCPTDMLAGINRAAVRAHSTLHLKVVDLVVNNNSQAAQLLPDPAGRVTPDRMTPSCQLHLHLAAPRPPVSVPQVLVLERLTGGDLLDHLHSLTHYTEAAACTIFQQVVQRVWGKGGRKGGAGRLGGVGTTFLLMRVGCHTVGE